METLFIWESALILVLAAWGIDVDHGADNIAFFVGFFPYYFLPQLFAVQEKRSMKNSSFISEMLCFMSSSNPCSTEGLVFLLVVVVDHH